MGHVKIMDCTLRDGAYVVNKIFGENVVKGIIEGLITAGIDVIEVGFLQDKGIGTGDVIYKNSKDAQKYIPKEKGNTIFAVLADYSRYTIDNLDDYTGESFDAVRICFFKNERNLALQNCLKVKEKGYKLFVQPVDILGYSDRELLDLIEKVNKLEPWCFSIVDTFGSMYIDDLQRVYSFIHHNITNECKIGFHSHNNMQMSSALAQEIIKMSYGQCEVIIDTTVSGIGRGAGNAPTELIAQYLVSKRGYHYNIDAILDVIDHYLENIRTRYEWGYSTLYFIAGSYGAHVNNVAFLKQKNSINSKDVRYILNRIGKERKRYNYELLEKTYTDYLKSDIDDTKDVEKLKTIFAGKNVAIVMPGATVQNAELINGFIKKKNAIAICINFIPENIHCDYLYLNNIRRYQILKRTQGFNHIQKIFTSNILCELKADYVINFSSLIKCGWEYMDNSAIMLLRLLDKLNVLEVGIAGLDGYSYNSQNYISSDMEQHYEMDYKHVNAEIEEMLIDFLQTRKHVFLVNCITKSRFEHIFDSIRREDI